MINTQLHGQYSSPWTMDYRLARFHAQSGLHSFTHSDLKPLKNDNLKEMHLIQSLLFRLCSKLQLSQLFTKESLF